jgi:peroxiredoxin
MRAFIYALLVSCLLSGLVYAKTDRPVMPTLEGRDLRGKKVRLDELRGNVVVVSFWATWCGPCKRELTDLNRQLESKKEKGLRVLAISMDGPETVADVRGVVRRHKWKMPVIHDQNGNLTAVHNPRGSAPYTIYVDRGGKMYSSHEGYSSGDRKEMVAKIDRLLREANSSGGSQ